MQKQDERITLAHGNGGELSHKLIQELFVRNFASIYLSGREDAALLPVGAESIAFTTDSHVVKPFFFPGGNIGKLAVCGTVNDLAVMGARPLYLSCAVILEEGFPLQQLEQVTRSMHETARECGVQVVTGDTKVVEKGMADGIFINTAGVGVLDRPGRELSLRRVEAGDKIIINGTIGDHGMAVFTAREDFPVKAGILSDCAALNRLIDGLFDAAGPGRIKFMRDPTRGGIGTTLNEFTTGGRFGIRLEERAIPLHESVRILAEMTGFDPLYIANEGKVLVIAAADAAGRILDFLHTHPLGSRAAVIGEVTDAHMGQVVMQSAVGGSRIVDMLSGDMLPRIC